MKKKNEKIPQWALTGHKKPVTRRDFLSYGLIPFAASTFMPNWMQLLAPLGSQAQSSGSCPSGGSSLIPFVQLNLSGGAGLMANYVPMDAAGNPLPSYSIMGMGDGLVPIVREFGNVPFAGNRGDGQLISNVLVGIRQRATATAIDKTAFIGMCVRSRDDSSENPFAMNGLANRAGLVGTKLPHLGSSTTLTGINQKASLYTPPAPLIVRGYSDVANSLSYTAAIGTGLNQAQKEKLTKFISDLNTQQTRKLASITTGEEVKNLIDCAGIKNNDLIREGTGSLDPRGNAAVAAAWGGINAGTNNNDQNLVFGTMVYNTLMGQAGSASLNLGGYDYHGGTRAATNGRDLAAGQVIGNIIQTAEALNKPLFLYVTSDGAVSSVNSETDRQSQFTSDRGSAGMAYLIMYHPSGRPVTSSHQIGHYTANQAADEKTVVGGSPDLATQAAFANYCQFNKRMDLYSKVVTRGLVETDRISQVVKVG